METQMDAGRSIATTPGQSAVRSVVQQSSLKKSLRPFEEVVRAILLFCGIISIFTTIGIVYVLLSEAVLFFGSKAFVTATAPVVDETQSVTLAESIGENERVISVTFDGERVPFSDGQYIHIDNETMRVEERGRRTISVERGADGTTSATHSNESTIFGMVNEQIRPQNALSAEDTVIELEPTFGREFEVGDVIRINLEIMLVTDVSPDTLTVERGYDDTDPAPHDANNESIRLADVATIGEFLTGTSWQPQIGDFGIWPLMLATLITSTIGMLVAIPLGLGAAIFLSEYAPRNVRNTLKPILEVLAGIPTVVFGFFALTFVSPSLRGIFGDQVQFQNLLSAGLVLGVLLIPYVSSFSEDALSAVPRALREASYGLGATKLETTIKIVLPAAVSGIGAALILAASRAVGETMIVALAAGSGPNFTFNLFEGAETMTGHIARISGGDLSYNSIDYNSIFSIGLTLFVLTFILNLISQYVTNRFRERY